jgi:biotin transport system substrate-specific component
MAAGLAIVFAFGVAWLAWFARPARHGLSAALHTGLYPFLPADLIKICVASAVMPAVWALVGSRRQRT